MAEAPHPASAPAPPVASGRVATWILTLLTAASLLLVVHNYGISLFPAATVPMDPAKIRPHGAGSEFAYDYNYRASLADREHSQRSRARLFEDGKELVPRKRDGAEVLVVGGGRWVHEPGRVVFSASDNSDPRVNGRAYRIRAPILYTRTTGRLAALVFLGCVAAWYLRPGPGGRNHADTAAPPEADAVWRRHAAAAAVVFLFGLYCNTGTLAPYANTFSPHVDPVTGYLYNADHEHFQVLFAFIDGADRSVWDQALMLRRILFPVLGWPAMKTLGFEIGGTLASLALNLAGFVVGVLAVRRQVGGRGAIVAAWILALAPGAAYWGGLPYPYALIFPGSLVLMAGLGELRAARGWRLALLSLGMGVLYLGYDFGAFFLPAALILLGWSRRWAAAVLSTALQILPLGVWLAFLALGLGQPLGNSNAGMYAIILDSFRNPPALGAWWAQVSDFPDVGLDVFFGSNFIFLPGLVLAVLALNAATSRVRLEAAEIALLVTALALFLLNNLAPAYDGWPMRGTWIARLYQPIFPVFVLFLARWWQHLPPPTSPQRTLIAFLLAGTTVGNALVVFGPIAGNPLGVSEYAFYKFYNHTEVHTLYESSLREHGRRPLGFPRSQK